jgi:phospholipid/cholesterol/gamma-HCH transport system substrate-binding protein
MPCVSATMTPRATMNATLPQLPPGTPPAEAAPPTGPAPPIVAAEYDPATGTYVGPDGKVYEQSDLANGATGQPWQSMLVPPGN